jgi:hypothetical protein
MLDEGTQEEACDEDDLDGPPACGALPDDGWQEEEGQGIQQQ